MTAYVLEYGWIVVGRKTAETADTITLSDASVVRRWNNGKGIGGIAKKANKNEYTLDQTGEYKVVYTLSADGKTFAQGQGHDVLSQLAPVES